MLPLTLDDVMCTHTEAEDITFGFVVLRSHKHEVPWLHLLWSREGRGKGIELGGGGQYRGCMHYALLGIHM